MSTLRNIIVLAILLIIVLLSLTTSSQTLTFPVDGKSMNNITSSFGPRNVGPYGSDYPNANYDYDFHCAINIGAKQYTDVYAVWDGTVVDVGSDYVTIEHDDSEGNWWVKYQHIVPTVERYEEVDSGEKIGDINNENHLDIRHYYSSLRGCTP